MKYFCRFIIVILSVFMSVFLTVNLFNGEVENVDAKTNSNKSTTTTEITTTTQEILYKELKIEKLYAADQDGDAVSWWYDDDKKIYYLFLPKLFDRNAINLEFTTDYDDAILSIYNDDNLIDEIKSGETTSALVYDDLTFTLERNVKEKKSYKIKVMQSTISSLFIDIDGGNSAYKAIVNDVNHNKSSSGYAVIADDDNNVIESTLDSIKGRGNASWERVKKPFILKFSDKVSVLGMRSSKKWVLTANYVEGSLSRNYIWYNLAQDLDIEYSVEVQPVDLYINNKYMGNYTISSKVEVSEGSVDIDEGSYLLEIENHEAGSDYITTNKGTYITIHNPDLEDLSKSERSEVKKSVTKLVNKIESLMFDPNTTEEEISKYIDLESMARFYWVQEYSENFDAVRGSNFFYVKNNKIYFGPVWDMDDTNNRSYFIANPDEYYVINNARLQARIETNWMIPMMKKQYFCDIVDKVFIEYYDVFSSLDENLQEYKEYINESAKMNYTYWNYSDMINTQEKHVWISGNYSFDSAVKMFDDFLDDRLRFYTKEYKGVLFESLKYQATLSDGSTVTGEIPDGVSITLPNSIKVGDTMRIYGVLNGEETLIDEFSIDNNVIRRDIKREKKAGTSSRKSIRYTYELAFKLGGE